MGDLFDMHARALRRDRAARVGAELFLAQRAFDDCLERLSIVDRHFERALLVGCPDPRWPEQLSAFTATLEVRDPGALFARSAGGGLIIEDAWRAPEERFDLVLPLGTLDTVNDLPLALKLLHYSMRPDGLFIGALSGGDTLPQLRNAMRAADASAGFAVPHVHPRIEASALAPLLLEAGFAQPVVDVDRVRVSYQSLGRLISDLRRMGATNILSSRPRFTGRAALEAAAKAFASASENGRTTETFEVLHFAAWTAK